ncbi:hypothetical protein MHYP_G00245280 [Metynnis hypsauchen]
MRNTDCIWPQLWNTVGGVLLEELTCPVCLDLYHDPRLLPRSHNFFLPCLRKLKGRSERGHLHCPECRQTYRCSAPWQKNFKHANIADGFWCCSQAEHPVSGKQHPTHRTEGVRCDYCPSELMDTNKGSTAVKTYLKCEVFVSGARAAPPGAPSFLGAPAGGDTGRHEKEEVCRA